MTEKHVAKKLEEANPQFRWKNTPDRYGTGIPDRALLELSGGNRFAWVELKYITALPKLRAKVKLLPKQALWLQNWKLDGGNAFVIVGVGSDKVVVFSKNFIALRKSPVPRHRWELINYEDVAAKLQSEMDGRTK